MTLSVSGTTVVNQNRSFVLGTATPGSPATGMIRYNSGSGKFEFYNGTAWIVFVNILPPENSTLWAWGSGSQGRLGNGTTTNVSSPVAVLSGFTDWIQISGGGNHTAAIRANGQAWAWGFNSSGRLGDGTSTNRSSPVSVAGGFNNWMQISAGAVHTAAIRTNGQAWCWGYNFDFSLGDGTSTNRSSPVSVVGGFTDWTQISAGGKHTAALRTNGQAWCWGYNFDFSLGDGTSTNRSSPVSVVGGFTNWTQISAGGKHTAALRSGQAWCWGYNTVGCLGDGTTTGRASPVSVVGGITDWVQISAGYRHTAAVRANGQAWCWGLGSYGRLGHNSTLGDTSPVSVAGGITDWTQISAGYTHTTAIRANGTAYAWGRNERGQLGTGNTIYRSSPRAVVGGFTDWVQILAADRFSQGLRANGTAWSWGFNNFGHLGDGTITQQNSPVSVTGGFTDWAHISNRCAIRAI